MPFALLLLRSRSAESIIIEQFISLFVAFLCSSHHRTGGVDCAVPVLF